MSFHLSSVSALCLATVLSAQVAWTPLNQLVRPGDRHGHAMAYDLARGVTVLFGGADRTVVFGDTWTFDGAAWTQRGVTGPAPRVGHTMVYDAQRQVVVLFGGYVVGSPSPSNETWEWNGSRWTLRTSPTSPPGRSRAASAPWPALGGVLIHGGYPIDGTPHFWLWNGIDWRDLTRVDTPRDASHAMAYHPGLHRLLVQGPSVVATWDGNSWSATDDSAGRRTQGRLVYDPVHERIVSFGGYPGTGYQNPDEETWVWRGLWARLDLPRQYLGRADFDMVFDTARRRAFLYGGIYLSEFGSVTLGDSVVLASSPRPAPYVDPSIAGFGFTTDCQHIGDGLFSLTNKPLLNADGAHAWVGEPFHLRCAGAGGTFAPAPVVLLHGTSNQFWNGVPLPLTLGALGRPDCSILVEVLATQPTTSTWQVIWPIPVPNMPPLAGSRHYLQVIGLSPVGSLFTTNGVDLVIGRRG